jgi:hypothetical protein
VIKGKQEAISPMGVKSAGLRADLESVGEDKYLPNISLFID